VANWAYFKLYPGEEFSALETLITDVFPRVVRRAEVDRWFYIRYIDAGGLHIRLRLRGSWDDAEAFRQALGSVLQKGLDDLPHLPHFAYRPAISTPAVNGPPRATGERRLVIATYEPEVAKFGERGIPIAEELFQVSSALAMETLVAERAGTCYRKTLTPLFMQSVLDAFSPSTPTVPYWQRYSTYWLAGAPVDAATWMERFRLKAEELCSRGIEVLPPLTALPPVSVALLVEWREALSRAALEYERLEDARPPGDDLAFQFIHLMNNRLGVGPLEESYFAALLSRTASAGGGTQAARRETRPA
jgi:thiopeptide-type bacteriocin biosynthesis protein